MRSSSLWMIGGSASDLDAEARADLERRLRQVCGPGRALLATCHRVELYGTCEMPPVTAPVVLGDAEVARHLFRVAAGLESAVLGEDEVLRQVRDALADARQGGGLNGELGRLFEEAIATGRRARALEARRGSSLAREAALWLRDRASLRDGWVLVVGSGAMGRKVARALTAEGATVIVAGRDARRADVDLRTAAELAGGATAIAVALRGPWAALAAVAPDPLPPLADLSAPSAVPSAVRSALGDRFLGIDDLYAATRRGGESVSEETRAGEDRPPWAIQAEQVAAAGIAAYLAWRRSRASATVVRALRARAEERRQDRVGRFLRGQPELSQEARAAIEALTRRIVGDLLHEPLVALRADEDGSRGAAARGLFGL